MRTTLNIDDNLLIAVKEVASREATSAGAVISKLLANHWRAVSRKRSGTRPSPSTASDHLRNAAESSPIR